MKQKNITMWNLFERLQKAQEAISDLANKVDKQVFTPVDYTLFITRDLNELIPLLKYKGRYYYTNNIGDLYQSLTAKGLQVKRPTFTGWLRRESIIDNQPKLWEHEILLVWAVDGMVDGQLFTCEGVFLSSRRLSVYKGNPINTNVVKTIDGENYNLHLPLWVWNLFKKKPAIEYDAFYHIDRNYGNSSIDNLVLIKKGSEMKKW